MTPQRGSAVRRPIAVGIAAGAAGAALALGAMWAAGEITSPANAQDPPSAGSGDFKLSVGQLRINQRISQAAVRRSNESLNLLDPLRGTGLKGWRTEDLRDGVVTGPKLGNAAVTTPKVADGAVTGPKVANAAVTGPKIADGAVGTAKIDSEAVTTAKIAGAAVTGPKLAPASVGTANLAPEVADRLPLWIVVSPNGTATRGSQGVTATRVNLGNYRLDFGRDMNACGYTGTQHVFQADQIGFVGIQVDVTNPNRLAVRTTAQNGTAADRLFTVQVTC